MVTGINIVCQINLNVSRYRPVHILVMARQYLSVCGYRSRINDTTYTIRDIIKVSKTVFNETRPDAVII